MRGLPSISSTESFRVRRWDAVVLGGALPGLVAAVRLAKRGGRILVVEEEEAARAFQGPREPFVLSEASAEGVLGACLRALGIPLIEQRRFASETVAVQCVLPDARVDVGATSHTLDELVAWGLAKPEQARTLLLALEEAADAERRAMLTSPVVRSARRLSRVPLRSRESPPSSGRPADHPAPARGLPSEASAAPERVRQMLEGLVRALSDSGPLPPSPEARARLLGSLLAGGTALAGADGGMRGLVRRRIQSLYGEMRTISGPIRFVAAAHQPGIALRNSDEIWVGRALVLNAPRSALARAVDQQPLPDALHVPPASLRRVSIHLEGTRDALPECMAPRVVCLRDPARPLEGTNLVRLSVFPGTRGRASVDLVASSVVPFEGLDRPRVEQEIEAVVRGLLPFSERSLVRRPLAEARWDTDAELGDPPRGGWPEPCEIRLSAKPPVYALDRAPVGGLGFEGDLLLGWRAGDAIAADLGD